MGLLITVLTPAAQAQIPAGRMVGVADGDTIRVLDGPSVQRKVPNLLKGNLQGNPRRRSVPSTIAPIIHHLRADHRMDRCHFKGETGDRLHAVLYAAGHNIKWLLRALDCQERG